MQDISTNLKQSTTIREMSFIEVFFEISSKQKNQLRYILYCSNNSIVTIHKKKYYAHRVKFYLENKNIYCYANDGKQ